MHNHNLRRQFYIAVSFAIAGVFVGLLTVCPLYPAASIPFWAFGCLLLYGNYIEWQRNYINRLEFHKELNTVRDEIAELGRDLSQQIRKTTRRITNAEDSVHEIRSVLKERGFDFPKRAHASASIVAGSPSISARASVTNSGPKWKRYYSHLKYWLSREAGFRD